MSSRDRLPKVRDPMVQTIRHQGSLATDLADARRRLPTGLVRRWWGCSSVIWRFARQALLGVGPGANAPDTEPDPIGRAAAAISDSGHSGRMRGGRSPSPDPKRPRPRFTELNRAPSKATGSGRSGVDGKIYGAVRREAKAGESRIAPPPPPQFRVARRNAAETRPSGPSLLRGYVGNAPESLMPSWCAHASRE